MYEHEGVQYARKYGTRIEVFTGIAYCTSGRLIKDNLVQKGDKIISKKRSAMGTVRFRDRNPFVAVAEKVVRKS